MFAFVQCLLNLVLFIVTIFSDLCFYCCVMKYPWAASCYWKLCMLVFYKNNKLIGLLIIMYDCKKNSTLLYMDGWSWGWLVVFLGSIRFFGSDRSFIFIRFYERLLDINGIFFKINLLLVFIIFVSYFLFLWWILIG